MQEHKSDDFIPFTKWKPFYRMTFIDYEITVDGKDIMLDERIIPQQLDVKEGDKFTVKFDRFGRVVFTKDL